jgi:hypothetical protein
MPNATARAVPAAPLDYAGVARVRNSRLDPMALATHLVGWLLVLLLFRGTVVFIVPRFEQFFRDFGVGLPEITRQFLGLARAERDWPFRLLVIASALAHSFAAAWWFRRAGELQKLAYRLALMLLLSAALLYVVAALCLPLFSAMSSLSGPRPVAPAGTTSPGGP